MTTEVKSLTKKEIKTATETIEGFIKKVGIAAEVEINATDEALDVNFDTEEGGIIIGYHGETLEGLQLLLSLAVSKKIGRFTRVSVDVGDYRKQRTEYLTSLVSQLKESVLQEKRERVVTSLKSWERRVVHMLLKDDAEVVTESEGSGRDRVLVIKPR